MKGHAWKNRLVFLGVLVALAGSGLATWMFMPRVPARAATGTGLSSSLRVKYAQAVAAVQALEREQAQAHFEIVSRRQLRLLLSQIQVDAISGQERAALADMQSLNTSLDNWRLELQGGTVTTQDDVDSSTPGSAFIPIVMYHYTPPDFEQQLQYLQQQGYTAIDMRVALAGLQGGVLPQKPVVITFDDGFANQMEAFALLKKYSMKATFYIINGGADSNWCIGAGRKYHLASQPPEGCGDAYLTWDQVRELDKSGLITIGGHTIDHPNLATETEAQQRYEIVQGKADLEEQLGHAVHDFAYPYGAYDQTTIQIAQQAGYDTAVTTRDGEYQAPGSEWTLSRVRDAWELP